MERKTPLVNGRTIFGLLLVIAAFACNGKNDRHKDYTSIAVLPFDNLNKSPELGYFSDGLAEDIRNDLSRTKGLKVCARASAFQFRGGVANIPEVGGKLKAGTLLEGSLRMEADHITVNVSLFDVSDGGRIWSGRFSENMENVSA